MDATVEKDCSALGGLFQAVISDMRTSSPIWEDFTCKATKMHSSLKSTLLAISAFLDAFQKVADMATSSRGATKEIGSALTRLCMRHRSIESKLKSFTGCILDTLVSPIQDKMEEWKKVVAQLDKDHAKEYKKARQEIKKAASDTVRLQKKVKKGKGDMQNRLDSAMQEVNDKYLLLEESEKGCVRTALIEERSRYCHFINVLKPFVDNEISLLTEVTHLQEIIDHLCAHTADPTVLPPASEQVIMDLKGVDYAVHFQTPPSSPSSLGSRKSSMCSISSINSSSSGSTQSHSPSHHNIRNRTTSQQPMVGTQRLMSVSSQDSGFTSQDTLFLRPTTPQSLNIRQTSERDRDSTGTPDVDSTPTTPSEHYPSTPSASSTWNNWPNAPNSSQKGDDFRPHTISSAYEKSHNRPALKADLFHPPEKDVEVRGAQGGNKHGRPHSTANASPYARPSATINKMQPVLPPLGPKPKPKAVPPPKVPNMHAAADPSPLYANAAEIAQMVADKKEVEPVIVHSPDSDTSSSPPTPSNTSNQPSLSHAEMLNLQEAIKSLDSCTAALNIEYDSDGDENEKQMQQNSLELAEAIRELEASTAALECTYDPQSHTSRTSLQCSSGYGTMNSTPSGSEDTIASGDYQLDSSSVTESDHEKYYTIPRSREVNAAYRYTLQPKRPASTAGIPTANNSLSRRSSTSNNQRPPPPVRRTASVTGAQSPAPQRASPPKEMSAPPPGPVITQMRKGSEKHTEGPYAELQLIQQSIQENRGKQQPPPPSGMHQPAARGFKHPGNPPGHHGPPATPGRQGTVGGHHGTPHSQGTPGAHGHRYPPPPGGHKPGPRPQHANNHHQAAQHHPQQHPQRHGRPAPGRQPPNSSPLYAEPNVIHEQPRPQGHANIVQSLNRKFSATGSQNSQGEEDFPLPPTEEELQEMEKIYSKPSGTQPQGDSLLLELKRRVMNDNSSEV